MSILVCGSIAYDTIMVFRDQFKNHILPDQIHILNVAFLVPDLRREFGGCAGNIAYALKLLGGDPLPMATLGSDGDAYRQRMQQLGIDCSFVRTIDDAYTAQAMIITDIDNNQINGFHPGAMEQAWRNRISARADIRLGIIAPDGRDAMLQHAQQFHDAAIPFIFDPGQQLPRFDGAELRDFVTRASWVAVNDYEGKMLSERTGWDLAEISRKVRGLVVTKGAQGSEVWTQGTRTPIAAVHASGVVDPTGCGDAYRGALLFGLERGWPLERCARLGNQLGSIKIAHRGPQNYPLDTARLDLR